jgi:SulP family sulfate permease
MEISGSLGDLGTLLPLAIGLVLVSGLNPAGLFFSVGLYYILAGTYFGIPVPVQPMKVIGAYAIATGMQTTEILASTAWMSLLLLTIGLTGAINTVGRLIPRPVIRGVQLSTGSLLMAEGAKFMMGTSSFQVLQGISEPYLNVQAVGSLPIGIFVGIAGFVVVLLLLENKRLPAGLMIVLGGIVLGFLLGGWEGLRSLKVGFNFPEILPFGVPSRADFSIAFFVLTLPQIPMTLGNAVVAYADLSKEYFGKDSKKVTYRSACISMAFANSLSFMLGGMPLCHGAGGLAAHYRFGARSGGSNIIIGFIFLSLAVFLGSQVTLVVSLLPMAVLGVLLFFAGAQLALTVIDMRERKDLFVTLLILGITLASNLSIGFAAGIAIAYALRSERLQV